MSKTTKVTEPVSAIAAALEKGSKENVTLVVAKALNEKRWEDAIKLLETGKIDATFHSPDSSNLLHLAATSGNVILIKELVTKGVSLEEINVGQDSPKGMINRQGHLSKGHREVVTYIGGIK